MAADITVIENPRLITLTDGNDTVVIISGLAGNGKPTELCIEMTSTNAATIKINTRGATTALNPNHAASAKVIISVNDRFTVKGTTSDSFYISY